MGVSPTRNGTITYNRGKFKPNDRQALRVAKVTHNCAANGLGAGNAIAMIPIPINATVLSATLKIDTVEDSAAVVSLGIAEDGITFVNAANAQVAAIHPSLVSGVFYNTAGNIFLSTDNACDTLVATVVAVYVEMDSQSSTN